jgi:hypothetical protein
MMAISGMKITRPRITRTMIVLIADRVAPDRPHRMSDRAADIAITERGALIQLNGNQQQVSPAILISNLRVASQTVRS